MSLLSKEMLLNDYDPRKMHMRAITEHGHHNIDIPVITKITKNLWLGGCINGLVLPEFFKHLISLYPWERYNLGEAQLKSKMSVWMYDAIDQDMSGIDDLAAWVNACAADAPTLVHCQAGLNRSATVVARALMIGTGATAEIAIRSLRELRDPAVLCNPAFEKWLRDFDESK